MVLAVQHRLPSPASHLCGLAWDGTTLWHSDADTAAIYQVDPGSGRILRKLVCPEVRTGLCFAQGALWQVAGHPKRIRKIRPQDGTLQDEIPIPSSAETACGLRVDPESYWIGREHDGWITRHSWDTGEILSRHGPVPSGDGLVLIGNRLWYTSHRAKWLGVVDTDAGMEIAHFALPGAPTDLCYDGKLLWSNHFAACEICAIRLPKV